MSDGFTTREESEMLVAYGLPSHSADCRYDWNKEKTCQTDIACGYKRFHLPCWTTGRLIEIDMLYRKNHDESIWTFCKADPQPIKDFVVKIICERLQNNEYDFSKLLEKIKV